MDYSFKYESLSEKSTWMSYLNEMFGTVMWVFLSNNIKVDMFANEMGTGVSWGLGLMITNMMFPGHFNAMRTMRKMFLGGDFCDGFMRLFMQMFGGLFAFYMFNESGWFGFVKYDSVPAGGPSLLEWSDWQGHATLFFALMMYAMMGRGTFDGMDNWISTPLVFGIMFAIGGENFMFAPNRMFAVDCDAFFSTLIGCWDSYLMYFFYSTLSCMFLKICSKQDFGMPKYDESD